jgi:hypothetical protein
MSTTITDLTTDLTENPPLVVNYGTERLVYGDLRELEDYIADRTRTDIDDPEYDRVVRRGAQRLDAVAVRYTGRLS